MLTRSPRTDAGNVSYRVGDVADAPSLARAAEGADVVLHFAGCKRVAAEFHRTNVVGTHNVVSMCEQAQVRRLIYLSSVGVIGPTSEIQVTEETPCHPANGYERSKLEAELHVRQFSARRPGTTTILRPTNVFGENDPEVHLLNLFRRLKSDQFFFVGRDISQYALNYLYVPEISALVGALIETTPTGDLFIVNTPTPLAEFIATSKRLLDAPKPVRHLPYWLVKTAALAGDRLPRRVAPVNSLKLAELTSRKQYSADLLARQAGWRPAFAMEDALRNMIAHYREKGLLA